MVLNNAMDFLHPVLFIDLCVNCVPHTNRYSTGEMGSRTEMSIFSVFITALESLTVVLAIKDNFILNQF